MEGSGDDMVGVPGIGESNVLPPGQDLLLGPLVRLAEMVVDLQVDCTFEHIERSFRVGLKHMVKSKFRGVINKKYHLMVMEGSALNSRIYCSSSVGAM
jgi:hypothetical protein